MRRLAAATVVFAALCLTIAAHATSTVVVTTLTPKPASPVVNQWYTTAVLSGGTASIVDLTGLGGNLESAQPLPTGAAKLTTDFTDVAKAEIGTFADYGVASSVLNDITLSYDYYKQAVAGGNTSAAPSIKLTIWAPSNSSTNDDKGTLVYEPYWNVGTPPTNAWQLVSINQYTGSGATDWRCPAAARSCRAAG